MARLKSPLEPAPLVLALFSALSCVAQEAGDLQFKEAGVCARCHVISVVEWGMSGHRAAGKTCMGCHGESRGHVVDERNNVKPERIPRGEAVAGLCASCHQQGCPKTSHKAGCQTCHHVHALLNPNAPPPAKDERLERLAAQSERYSRLIAEGERLAGQGKWEQAAREFRAAIEVLPSDRKAAARLAMCERRLQPALAGFDELGEPEATTGLPRQVRVSGTDMVMVLVPGGEFDMGSERFAAARPVHTVGVEAFYLGKFEITQDQWKALMGANPSAHHGKDFPEADRMPVEQVSWEDAQAFVRKLNEVVPAGGFRLPTEAEWEFAAKAGGAPLDGNLPAVAWFDAPEQSFAPRPVGSKAPGKFGLHDMLGNVWEWCTDQYSPYPGADGGEVAADSNLRVLRGGGFADSADLLNPAMRHGSLRDRRLRWNGLRIARSVPVR